MTRVQWRRSGEVRGEVDDASDQTASSVAREPQKESSGHERGQVRGRIMVTMEGSDGGPRQHDGIGGVYQIHFML